MAVSLPKARGSGVTLGGLNGTLAGKASNTLV